MPTAPTRVPSYRLHKPSGLAVVTIAGEDKYLGRHGTPESRAEYDRLIAEWLTTGRNRLRPANAEPVGPTVGEMILAVWEHAQKHYRGPDGTPTGELDNLRDALRPLRRLYGHTPAGDFGPLALRAVREEMIRSGLCRQTVNARVNRIRRAFRWAASLELIPASVPQALATVPGLQHGRCDAPEGPGVKPVRWEDVEATLPELPGPVAAMVLLMRYSNCRAEDAVIMRGCDLRTEGDVWTYTPESHKNAWRGYHRTTHLGEQAQEVIRPFLRADLQAYLFSPREALEEHHARRRARRKTKRTPSELRQRRKQRPRWVPRLRYDVNTFQQAVRRACRRAGVPGWSVLQVRHTRATEVRERYGIEGAAATLGHRRVETSQIYAEKNERLSREIAREIG
jgi:integrase